ncbi:hypothetical protein [Phyllobacterium ifriqiyense]|uniref:hypothetical protein n=1 Tax=Phyllobacterium ifriqiyense TaxID=314238 RepID=UPI0033982546
MKNLRNIELALRHASKRLGRDPANLVPGAAIGSVSRNILKRLMVRRTIKQHLDKEIRFAAVKHPPPHIGVFAAHWH